jgi:hypothetical protein
VVAVVAAGYLIFPLVVLGGPVVSVQAQGYPLLLELPIQLLLVLVEQVVLVQMEPQEVTLCLAQLHLPEVGLVETTTVLAAMEALVVVGLTAGLAVTEIRQAHLHLKAITAVGL